MKTCFYGQNSKGTDLPDSVTVQCPHSYYHQQNKQKKTANGQLCENWTVLPTQRNETGNQG